VISKHDTISSITTILRHYYYTTTILLLRHYYYYTTTIPLLYYYTTILRHYDTTTLLHYYYILLYYDTTTKHQLSSPSANPLATSHILHCGRSQITELNPPTVTTQENKYHQRSTSGNPPSDHSRYQRADLQTADTVRPIGPFSTILGLHDSRRYSIYSSQLHFIKPS